MKHLQIIQMGARARKIKASLQTIMLLFTLSSTDRRLSAQQETPPPPGPPRSVQFPKPVEKTLSNGLRVIVASRPESVPLVTAMLMIKTGAEADPPELSGLADMTANLLAKGTTTRSAPEIAEAIEALGGSLDASARWDSSTISINVLSSRLPQAMEILSDVVRHPVFKEEEIERQRRQTLDGLQVALRQPGSLARFVASRVLFGDAPYAHPISGTLETVQRIDRDAIVRFHRTYYRPDNAVLVIGGRISPEGAFALAERFFGDWARPAQPLTSSTSSARLPAKSRIVVIDKPDAGQAAVILVRAGIKRTDADYFRGLVANSVLGGGFSSRLNQEIRIRRGLSYGASSALDVRRDVGPFIASAQTRNETADEVAALMITELERLATDNLPDAELTPRKAALIGNFARTIETTGGLVAQVASLALYGLRLDEINDYIRNIQAITASDVQRFARERLNASEANIVIVGNARSFLDDLKKRFPNVEVIKEDELDLNSGTLRRSQAQTGKEAGP
jgi:zinc protease